MPQIRLLVVDDSNFIRRVLQGALAVRDDIEIVGTAADGRAALTLLHQCRPDIVILDVEMPEMNGIQFLKELRKTNARLPVIMFSKVTERGAATTIDALASGASDYVTKPSDSMALEQAMELIRAQLIPRIVSLAPRAVTVARPPAAPPRPTIVRSLTAARGGKPVEVLAIGSSTGGPDALVHLFGAQPPRLEVPVLMVQHMPPVFTRHLARRLETSWRIPVVEGEEGMPVERGRAYLAPGDYHMTVTGTSLNPVLKLNQGPQENSCRPAVDVLFRSVAEVYGPATLAVILTGMGKDGLVGCQRIRERGGRIIVQDEATSVVWGMPGFVAQAGLAEAVLPLDRLGGEILTRLGGVAGRSAPPATGTLGI